jgi:4a-hydroxytetrahydrobiopterin dehydratase
MDNVQHCEACEGGVDALNISEIESLLKKIPLWNLNTTNDAIERQFDFNGFAKTIAFVNAIAWIATNCKHHPEICFGYNFCKVKLTTHSISGLTKNDFIVAAKIDNLIID